MTAVTAPMMKPWTRARSPLSAKKSMNTSRMPAVKNNTTQIGVGTIPSAAWSRSRRPASRASRRP